MRIGERLLMKKGRKIYKIILILIVLLYVGITLINQQQTLNQYTEDSKELAKQIEEEQQTKAELEEKKENVDSLEFIEQMAREKLEMYYPNERVYVDIGS